MIRSGCHGGHWYVANSLYKKQYVTLKNFRCRQASSPVSAANDATSRCCSNLSPTPLISGSKFPRQGSRRQEPSLNSFELVSRSRPEVFHGDTPMIAELAGEKAE